MNKSIAKKLILLRGKKSRQQVADEIGVSLSAMHMYENGYRVPKDEITVRLAEYYKVSVEDLFFSPNSHVM